MEKFSFVLERGEGKRLLFCRAARVKAFGMAAFGILAIGFAIGLVAAIVDFPNKYAQAFVRMSPALSGVYASILLLCAYTSISALKVPKDLTEVVLEFDESLHQIIASINGKKKVINVFTILVSPQDNTLVIRGRIAGIMIPLSSISPQGLAYICEFAKNAQSGVHR